jgi:dipeptidyl aminopeptidase/acylaminoacyl peptidase
MHRFACYICMFLFPIGLAAQQKLAPPTAITDPAQIESKRRDVPDIPVEKLFATRSLAGATLSPDGKTVAFSTNISRRLNIWTVPVEGGWPTQLTVSDQRQTHPVWSPSGKFIAYQQDKDGDEQWDIYIVSASTGEVTNLTNTAAAAAEQEASWSPNSRYLAWLARPKDAAANEIEVFDMLLRRRKALTKNTPDGLMNERPVWSKDGKWIAFTQETVGSDDANVFVAEVATGKIEKLTPHEGKQSFTVTAWSPDGKKLLVASDGKNGYENIALLDVATKQLDWITDDKWELEPGTFSPNGKLLTFTANVDGYRDLYVYDVASKHGEALPLPKGQNYTAEPDTAFTGDGRQLLFVHSGPRMPADVWVYDLGSKKSQQVTHAWTGGMNPDDLVEPQLVHFPSRDGKYTLSAWVYAPYNQMHDKKAPAIVWVHGGPASQSRADFDRGVQFLVNKGYFVIQPNVRGSSGYGKKFMDANRYDFGGGDAQDVLAAADWIQKTSYVDPKKLVVMGHSYGGYMALMEMGKYPDPWAAGVSLAPMVNLVTLVKSSEPWIGKYLVEQMGEPEKSAALYRERSASTYVENIKAPLLLIVGGEDPRCPPSEAQQIADAVRKRGGTVEYKVYENEGHNFARVEDQIDSFKRVSEFLKFEVPAPGCGCSLEE